MVNLMEGQCEKLKSHTMCKMRLLFLCLVVVIPSVLSDKPPCILQGQIYTKLPWYGFLVQKTFIGHETKIHYQLSYPVKHCCVNLLIYYDDQLREMKESMSCREREAMLPDNNHQVIPLYGENAVGCTIWNETGEPMQVCHGERDFRSYAPRTWYFAVSRCGSTGPLELNYFFNITGYDGDCEAEPLTKSLLPKEEVTSSYVYVSIALGILAGAAIIVAVVFIVLWCLEKRQQQKTTGSVTSSQATMTQDIFYVNPSLSDREHSDSQYSQSSSENYYEVIPDRRSYESINTQLALTGQAVRGVNLNSTHPKDYNRPPYPPYIFEDYPPPPYQPPPQVQNGGLTIGQATGHSHIPSGVLQLQSNNSGSGGGAHTSGAGAPQHFQMQTIPSGSARASAHSLQNGGPRQLPSSSQPSGASNISPNHHSTNSGSHQTVLQQHPGGTLPPTSLHQHQNSGSHQNSGHSSQNSAGSHQLQTRNGSQQTLPSVGGRHLPNPQHAKLLHQAYRIQQFETTA